MCGVVVCWIVCVCKVVCGVFVKYTCELLLLWLASVYTILNVGEVCVMQCVLQVCVCNALAINCCQCV